MRSDSLFIPLMASLFLAACGRSPAPVAATPAAATATAATATAPEALAATPPMEPRHFQPYEVRPATGARRSSVIAGGQVEQMQSFTIGSDGYLGAFQLSLHANANPADFIYEIARASSASEPPAEESVLARGIVDGSSIPRNSPGGPDPDFVTLDLSRHRLPVKKGEIYYIRFSFSGSPGQLDTVSSSPYRDGQLFTRNGTAPIAVPPDTDLAFRVFVISAPGTGDPNSADKLTLEHMAPPGRITAEAQWDPMGNIQMGNPSAPANLQVDAVVFAFHGHYYVQVAAFNSSSRTAIMQNRGGMGPTNPLAPISVSVAPAGGGPAKLVYPPAQNGNPSGPISMGLQIGPNDGLIRIFPLSDAMRSLPPGDYHVSVIFNTNLSDQIAESNVTLRPADSDTP